MIAISKLYLNELTDKEMEIAGKHKPMSSTLVDKVRKSIYPGDERPKKKKRKLWVQLNILSELNSRSLRIINDL